MAPSLPQEVPEERTFKHQPLQEKLPREMEPVKGFPRVRNIYDVISDPEGIDEVELYVSFMEFVIVSVCGMLRMSYIDARVFSFSVCLRVQ